MKKGVFCSSLMVLMVLLAISVQETYGSPLNVNRRIKRVSDQRLAELVTKLGLKNYKGQLVTVPVGNGLDFSKIGRKRRSQQSPILSRLFNASEEDNGEPESTSDLLQQLQRHYERLQLQHEQQRLHDSLLAAGDRDDANVDDDTETPLFYVRKR